MDKPLKNRTVDFAVEAADRRPRFAADTQQVELGVDACARHLCTLDSGAKMKRVPHLFDTFLIPAPA